MDGVEKKELEAVHSEAVELFTKTYEYQNDEYERGRDDIDHVMGNQWPEDIRAARAKEGRPCMTENHLQPYVNQVVNSARQARPRVKISPVDDKGDVKVAEINKGLIRNIERRSGAAIAYDTAAWNAAAGGYGWIRINLEFEDPKSFKQRPVIEQVLDWQSVLLDMNSKRPDGSDSDYGFVYTDLTETEFDERYPDASKADFTTLGDRWHVEDHVRVVEYYCKKKERDTLYKLFLVSGKTVDVLQAARDEMEEAGDIAVELDKRDTMLEKVMWYKMSGHEVLEHTEWLGKYIPLVPVYGLTVWHEGRRKSYSLVHQAINPQQRLNYLLSTNTEFIALQPKAPWVIAEGQDEGWEGQWETANIENYSALKYVPTTFEGKLVPPPQRSQPIMGSTALVQEQMTAKESIRATLGMFEEGRGEESNAISGVAIKERSLRGDNATYHFMDNLAASIRHVGLILVDLIPQVYDEAQILRVIGEDDVEKTIPVNQPFALDGKGNEVPAGEKRPAGVYDLKAGEYDVDVDIGPSYATQQQEFLDTAKTLLQANPEFGSIAGDYIILAAGGPYADELAKRVRATMPPEHVQDDPMAAKVLELMNQLKASEEQKTLLQSALEDKAKDIQFDNQIKAGELEDKQKQTQIKALETMAKVRDMQNKQVTPDALADFADAMLELNEMVQDQNDVISALLSQEEQKRASGEPKAGFIRRILSRN